MTLSSIIGYCTFLICCKLRETQEEVGGKTEWEAGEFLARAGRCHNAIVVCPSRRTAYILRVRISIIVEIGSIAPRHLQEFIRYQYLAESNALDAIIIARRINHH